MNTKKVARYSNVKPFLRQSTLTRCRSRPSVAPLRRNRATNSHVTNIILKHRLSLDIYKKIFVLF